MKKLLVLISAIGMSLTACQKVVKDPAPAKGGHINKQLIIQGQVATRHWDGIKEDCLNGGQDCLDEVVCTPSFWDILLDWYWKSRQGQDEAWREFSTMAYKGANNNHDGDLRRLLGEDMFQKVLSGELKLKLRFNANKPNILFLGLFESSAPAVIRLVIPVTKSN